MHNNASSTISKTLNKYSNTARGKLTGWDFKTYLLVVMLYRFVSDAIIDYMIDKFGIDYTNAIDSDIPSKTKTQATEDLGYFIYPSQLFARIFLHPAQDALASNLTDVFKTIEDQSTPDFRGTFTNLDLESRAIGATEAERSAMLESIAEIVSELPSTSASSPSDVFGDVYEQLMTYYAQNAGRSGGEYYTPQGVGRLMSKIVCHGRQAIYSIYDPACGTGGLLIAALREIGVTNVSSVSGQEKNPTTHMLARGNMIMHGVPYRYFDIAQGDTLKDPQCSPDDRFDVIVANPPYSVHWEGSTYEPYASDPRFSSAGAMAPDQYADLAFVQHMLYHLADDGIACIVEFPSVLYREGAEQKIRKHLVDANYVDAVIQLPENLFFGTPIATCLLILRKDRDSDDKVCFVDASSIYTKSQKMNVLSDSDIEEILDLFLKRKEFIGKCSLASREDIEENGYAISPGIYICSEGSWSAVDIDELEREIVSVESRINELGRYAKSMLDIAEGDPDGKTRKEVSLADVAYYATDRVDASSIEAGTYIGVRDMLQDFQGISSEPNEPTEKRVIAYEPNDILLGNIRPYLRKMWLSDRSGGTNGDVLVIRIKDDAILPDYLFYVLAQSKFVDYDVRNCKRGKMPRGNKEAIMRYRFELPPIDEQEKIVEQLDVFNEISTLLRRQSELRESQYAYYRDLLLR